MPRHPKPTELALHNGQNGVVPGPNSSPMNLQGVDLTSFGGGFEHDVAAGLTPLPPLPNSPPSSPRTTQGQGRNFLSFKKQEPRQQSNSRQGSNEDERPGTSSMSKIYHLRKNPGSTPELSLVGSNENVHKENNTEVSNPPLPPRPQPSAQRSEDSLASSKRKDKFKIGINRTKSLRRDSDSKSRLRPPYKPMQEQQIPPPQTAPLNSDWPGAESRMAGNGKEKDRRGKSAERAPVNPSEENLAFQNKAKDSNNKNFGKSAQDAMSKGRKAIFGRLGKLGRSHSSHEKEVPDSEYKLTVINLPLVEQTRRTRISKELSGCRDKTEYWMPSLPWRCIDYLNTNAEEEGLYRIPGSGPKVKHWQRRFDQESDIDLLSEEVADTNEIASMLKAWLREQPTEIMPMEKQKELAILLEKENPNYKNVGQPASQVLRDTLSELPPFNYYLLFAITCHLSLLLTNKDRNKMDLNNLAVCVNPCLNLERWLFNYLVGDWRHCWQGCYTEKDYLEIEKLVEQGIDPNQQLPQGLVDERSLNSSVWATTIHDDATSEAVSIQSSLDDRALSSRNGSVAGKPAGGHDESRSTSRDTSQQRHAENIKPMTYMPVGSKGYSNGNVGLGIDQDKRPRTADQRYEPDLSVQANMPPPLVTKNRSNSTTPRVGHNRSRSDLPATPVKTGFGAADGNFAVHPS